MRIDDVASQTPRVRTETPKSRRVEGVRVHAPRRTSLS